jgi:hypothetical protein
VVCDILVSRWGDVKALASAISDQGCVRADVVTALLNMDSRDIA